VIRYKSNLQKSIAFLDDNNKHVKSQNLNMLPFIILKMRYLSVNLTKYLQSMYVENFLNYSKERNQRRSK
jgi:hypothetical protein